MLPIGPVPDQVAVCDENAGRVGMGRKDPDRFAGLNQPGLVVFQVLQSVDDLIETFPITSSPADPAIDDQLLRSFGNLLVETVHQHSQGSFG